MNGSAIASSNVHQTGVTIKKSPYSFVFQQLLHFGRFGIFESLVGFLRSNVKSKDVGFPDCLALLEFAPKQNISRQIRCDPIIDYELMVIPR